MRHEKEEANLQMLKAAREFLGNGVCAADLAGNEAAFPMSQFMNLFAEVNGWRCRSHFMQVSAAVCRIFWMQCSAVLPEWAMELRFAGRRSNPDLQRQTHGIEMCPLSNMQTKAVRILRISHPGVFAGEPSCYDQYG